MNSMIENARTIDEKRNYYTFDLNVNKDYLKEWRNVRTLLSDTYFKEMLTIENISENEFAFALQPMVHNGEIEEDQWYKDFIGILDTFSYNTINFSDGIQVSCLPFLYFIKKQLVDFVDQLDNVIINEDVVNSFVDATFEEMFNIVGKLIAIELEIYKQSQEFVTEDKEKRFQEFMKNNFNSKDGFLNFYTKYPVAARVAVTRIKYLENNYKNLLSRLERDFNEICELLQIEKLHLIKLVLSTGDSHSQGNAVVILHFEGAKLVYKPRNLCISEAFQTFIDWYTNNSNLLEIKIPKGVYYEEYSYVEYIEKAYCNNQEEVKDFYLRYGYLISICYLLGINDLHLENVIAMGEHPVIIDIETMFQVIPKFRDENIYLYLNKILGWDSVANSCLLPTKLDVGIGGQVELSALNGRKAKTGTKYFAPVNINTDEFRYEKQDAYFEGGDNIPILGNQEEVDYQIYRLRIIEGFDDFMQFVLEHKEEFIEVVSAFKGKRTRMLLKGTERYASMNRYANHPKYNVEMKYRERLMMNIWAYPYADKRIIKSEIKDMLFNDIPIFFTMPDSTSIVDSRGKIYENYFEHSGFDVAVNRVRNLDEKVLGRQRTIMIASLGLANDILNERIQFIKTRDIQHHFSYLNAAEQIAKKLMREAIVKGEEASFINIDCDKDRHWKVIACDESLYGGVGGIAILFLILYVKTKKEEYLLYYQKLLRVSVTQAKELLVHGGFDGWLSPVYPMLLEYKMLGTISEKKHLKYVIDNLNNLSDKDIDSIVETDYISGIAGILRLINKMKVFSDIGKINDSIFNLFEKVLKIRVVDKKEKSSNQVGIAHGLSGIALSLSSVQEKDTDLIKELLIKEMSLQVKEKDRYKWCWGFSGMIQARIEIMKESPSIEVEEQLSELIKMYESSLVNIPQEDSLCHGTGSILITLKSIYEYNGEKKWMERMHVLLSNISHNAVIKGYMVPKLFDVEMKGIFDGISGVGFSYLYSMGDIPNLLLLNSE